MLDDNRNVQSSNYLGINSKLPYQVAPAGSFIESLIEELREAVKNADLTALLSCSNHARDLIELKLHIEPANLIMLVKISYQLVINPPFDHVATREEWATFLLDLFKLKTLQNEDIISYSDLGLDWKPLFDLVEDYLYRSTREAKLYVEEKSMKSILKMIEKCQKFFPSRIVDSLFKEIAQYLYPLEGRNLARYISMIILFIPPIYYDERISQLLRPNSVLWSVAGKRIEVLNMLLLARLSKSPVRDSIYLEEMAPFLFNLARRHLKFPGSEGGPKYALKYAPEDKAGNRLIYNAHNNFHLYFAKWIVRSIDDGNVVLVLLEDFLQSLDSFCHPSNNGSWTPEITFFLTSLVRAMNKRCFRTDLKYTLKPLSAETIQKFCKTVWLLVGKLVFSKNLMNTFSAQEILKGLSNLSPDFVLPEILAIVESSILSLTEPHRTNASIGMLAMVYRKMLDLPNFPLGVVATLSLMNNILPGIDSNDPLKTASTLGFLNGVFMLMPVYDLSKIACIGEDCSENQNNEATANFESFILMFLDQSFQYVRNITKPNEGDTSAENGITGLLINAWDLLAMQTSSELQLVAFKKIFEFAKNETHVHAAVAVGYLVGKFTRGNPNNSFDELIGWVCEEIKRQLSRETGIDDTVEDQSCSRLIWLVSILHRSIQFAGGDALGNNVDRLFELIRSLLPLKQKTISKLSSKALKCLIKGLATFYPLEWKSWQGESVSLENFGETFLAKDVVVDWHVPNDEKISKAIDIVEQVIPLIKISLQSPNQGSIKAGLMTLRNLIKGAVSIRMNLTTQIPFFPATGAIASVDLQQKLDQVIKELSDLLLAFSQASYFSVEAKCMLIECIGVQLTYRGTSRNTFENFSKGFGYLKSLASFYKKEKRRPRIVHVKKAYLQHLCRVEKQSYFAHLTIPRYYEMVSLLQSMSLDAFEEIQNKAQDLLEDVLDKQFKGIDQSILGFISVAGNPSIKGEELKAVLQALRTDNLDLVCYSWDVFEPFVKFVISFSERPGLEKIPKIYEILTQLFVESVKSFTCPPLRFVSNESLCNLLAIECSDGEVSNDQQRIVKFESVKTFLREHAENPNNAWRSKAMSYTFLQIITNELGVISAKELFMTLEGCASDVFDIRFSASQAAKPLLHLYAQQLSSLPKKTKKISNQAELFEIPPTAVFNTGLVGWTGESDVEYEFKCDEKISTFERSKEGMISSLIPVLLQRSCLETDLPSNAEDTSKIDFRADTARLAQGLTDVFGPVILEELVKAIPTITLKGFGKQRAISEWVSGILKSLSFILDFASFNEVITKTILPIIKESWSDCSPDSTRLWYGCFYFASRGRDMRVYDLLKKQLIIFFESGPSGNVEALAIIQSLQGLAKGAGWRFDGADLISPLQNLFKSPFLVVRREAAILAKELLRCSFRFDTLQPDFAILSRLKSSIASSTVTEEKDLMIKAAVEIGHSMYLDPVLTGLWPFTLEFLETFFLANGSDEIEMQVTTKTIIRRLAWSNYCPNEAMSLSIIDVAYSVASNVGLKPHVRKLAVEFLTMFYGRNYIAIGRANCEKYQSRLLSLIADPLIDVREAAASALTNLFHSKIKIADEVAPKVTKDLTALVRQIKEQESVISRHSVVLIASSLVLAIPYRLPQWAPRLLFTLTRFLPDRAPIQGTVRKTFSEFKRTHADNWASEREAFSEEELDAISELLVSPSYYA